MNQYSSKKNILKIKNLANENDEFILKLLGFEDITERGIKQECPIHKGDNASAFSYKSNGNIWNCFTHQCHKEYGNDLIGLVRGIKKFSFKESIIWLEKVLKNQDSAKFEAIIEEDIHLTSIQYDIDNKKVNKIYTEEMLNLFHKDYSSLKNRKFSEKTVIFFEGGIVKNKNYEQYHGRFLIPIRNSDKNIVGFTGRSLFERCENCRSYHDRNKECPNKKEINFYTKWRHFPTNFKKNIELYNINHAKPYIKETKTAIITEGPFDVWNLWELGVKNVVSTLGINMSNEQCNILAESGCLNLILCYDSDKAGSLATEKIMNKNMKSIFNIKDVKLPIDTDPGDLEIEEFNIYLKPLIDSFIERYSQ